jgi:hypothetical protein
MAGVIHIAPYAPTLDANGLLFGVDMNSSHG